MDLLTHTTLDNRFEGQWQICSLIVQAEETTVEQEIAAGKLQRGGYEIWHYGSVDARVAVMLTSLVPPRLRVY